MNWQLIALMEAAVILLLGFLIIFRRIGRPLSEAEAQYRIKLKEERKQKEAEDYQKEISELNKQEILIAEMQTPITLISVAGEGTYEPFNVCVQDGNKKIHNLLAEHRHISKLPKLQSLYRAAGWVDGGQWVWLPRGFTDFQKDNPVFQNRTTYVIGYLGLYSAGCLRGSGFSALSFLFFSFLASTSSTITQRSFFSSNASKRPSGP